MSTPDPAFQKGEDAPPVDKSAWEAHLDLIAGWVIEECRSRIQAEREGGIDKNNANGIL